MSSNPSRARKRLRRPNQEPRIQPVDTGAILSNASLDDRFIGEPAAHLQDGLLAISAFLRRHAMHRSLDASPSSSDDTRGESSLGTSARIYASAIEEFRTDQMERQAAGLRTNTSGASAAVMERVVDCHANALKHGLDSVMAARDDGSFWLNDIEAYLCSVHSKLCPDISQSGRYRDNRVKASNTSFARPEDVMGQMELFASAVERLRTKWGDSPLTADVNHVTQASVAQVYRRIGIAAIVVFGINDIHPFQDGNGRTARIFMNMALKKLLGLPFPIIITATQPQRREYVDALREGRSRLRSISTTSHSSSSMDRVGLVGPAFVSMIEVIIDRVLHAVVQINSLLESKAQAAVIDEEARAARRFRDRAAEGQCAICLDNNPNISTLCCGVAVHMTCLAEWLGNQGSCIGCRKPMPLMNQQTQQQQQSSVAEAGNAASNSNDGAVDNAEDDTETTEDTAEDDTETTEETTVEDNDTGDDNDEDTTEDNADTTEDTTVVTENHQEENTVEDSAEDSAEDTTTVYDTAEEEEEEVLVENHQDTEAEIDSTTEDTAEDGDTTCDDNAADDDQEDTVDDTTEDTTEDISSDEDGDAQRNPAPRPGFCGQCRRNRFAVDCNNMLCGSCCQLYGRDSCVRHNC